MFATLNAAQAERLPRITVKQIDLVHWAIFIDGVEMLGSIDDRAIYQRKEEFVETGKWS